MSSSRRVETSKVSVFLQLRLGLVLVQYWVRLSLIHAGDYTTPPNLWINGTDTGIPSITTPTNQDQDTMERYRTKQLTQIEPMVISVKSRKQVSRWKVHLMRWTNYLRRRNTGRLYVCCFWWGWMILKSMNPNSRWSACET